MNWLVVSVVDWDLVELYTFNCKYNQSHGIEWLISFAIFTLKVEVNTDYLEVYYGSSVIGPTQRYMAINHLPEDVDGPVL